MNKEILYKIIKILILILIIYLVCKYIPEKTLSTSDILIIVMIIVGVYIIFELLNNFSINQEQFAHYYQTPNESMMSIEKRMGSLNMDNQYTNGNPPILNNNTINPVEVSDNMGTQQDVDNSVSKMANDFKTNQNSQKDENYKNSYPACPVCPYLDMPGTASLAEWQKTSGFM
jgi:c-di-AMP phosphodiesterase-like protein